MTKSIIVTGATSGVGLDIVETFVKKGWQTIGLARNRDKLHEMSKTLGDRFLFFPVDIRNYEEVATVFQELKMKNGPVDVLVNNAATFKMQNFLESSSIDINNIIDTNLKGTLFCTLEALKNMCPGGSRIINIASVAATHGIANQAVYCASKFGVDGFAEALNQEIIKHGTSISTICPGGIDTPLWNKESNPYPGDKSKLLKPADITRAVEYIVGLPSSAILKKLTIFPSNEWH